MKRSRFLIVMALFVALFLGACTRAASSASDSTDIPLEDPIEAIFSVGATLTAQAGGGIGVPTSGTEGIGGGEGEGLGTTATPTSPVATATPTEISTAAPVEDLAVPSSYTLQKGEFPFCIARRFNINVDTLLNANGLSKNGVFNPGLTLTIPQSAGPFAGTRALLAHPAQYTVVSGDTFHRIACKYGDVWPENIAQANSLDINDPLSAGQTLQIP